MYRRSIFFYTKNARFSQLCFHITDVVAPELTETKVGWFLVSIINAVKRKLKLGLYILIDEHKMNNTIRCYHYHRSTSVKRHNCSNDHIILFCRRPCACAVQLYSARRREEPGARGIRWPQQIAQSRPFVGVRPSCCAPLLLHVSRKFVSKNIS